MQIAVGADPEFFLKREKHFISAHDIVPGTKEEPYKLPCGGAVQADGTAVEINIPPSATAQDFSDNLRATLSDVRKIVPKELEFSFTPSVVYPKKYFDTIPDKNKELGCNPDYNAHRGAMNNPPRGGSTLRTGAGHIHVGWTAGADPMNRSHFWDCCEIVKELDNVFTYPQTLWDKDTRRQELYGQSGAFRPKSYGLEYRVLSNAWLRYPKLWPWLFETTKKTFTRVVEGQTHGPIHYPLDASLLEVNLYIETAFGAPRIPQDWANG